MSEKIKTEDHPSVLGGVIAAGIRRELAIAGEVVEAAKIDDTQEMMRLEAERIRLQEERPDLCKRYNLGLIAQRERDEEARSGRASKASQDIVRIEEELCVALVGLGFERPIAENIVSKEGSNCRPLTEARLDYFQATQLTLGKKTYGVGSRWSAAEIDELKESGPSAWDNSPEGCRIETMD